MSYGSCDNALALHGILISMQGSTMSRPNVFIGSSKEGKIVADLLAIALDHVADVQPWYQGVFGLGLTTIESLIQQIGKSDFAILVLTKDDVAEQRGQTVSLPRDNVLFELGLFMGSLGRERCFIVHERSAPPKLPSDLAGLATVTYLPPTDGTPIKNLGAAPILIAQTIAALGERTSPAAVAVACPPLLEAVTNRSGDWSVCFVGEDQAAVLGTVIGGLSQTGGKVIDCSLSYWGTVSANAWRAACNDPYYKTMSQSIKTFPRRWLALRSSIGEIGSYISLGPGTGEKDIHLLQQVEARKKHTLYVCVDMSIDFLRSVAREAMVTQTCAPGYVIPIQIDFAEDRNDLAFTTFLNSIPSQKPRLFSLLGNTIANFDDDVSTLRRLANLLTSVDFLLVEVSVTRSTSVAAREEAQKEYESHGFRSFAVSGLLQFTDLEVSTHMICCETTADESAITVTTVHQNRRDGSICIRLPNGDTSNFEDEEKIRVYLTRKYTEDGVARLYQAAGLSLLKEETYFSGEKAFLGFKLLLLKRAN